MLTFFFLQLTNAIKFSLIIILLLFNDNKKVCFVLFLFILSLLVTSSGRLTLILNLMLVIIVMFRVRPTYVSLCLFPLLIIGLPLIFSLKSIIYSISVNGFVDFNYISSLRFDWSSYVMNFGHPLFSFLSVDKLVDKIGYRYFYDYLQGFLFYLKLIGLDYGNSITYFNTEIFLGVQKSIIPPSYLSFGFVQMSYFGIFISGFFYRFIGHLGWVIYRGIFINKINNAAIFYICFMCANTFYHGDVRILVMTILFPFLMLLIIEKMLVKTI